MYKRITITLPGVHQRFFASTVRSICTYSTTASLYSSRASIEKDPSSRLLSIRWEYARYKKFGNGRIYARRGLNKYLPESRIGRNNVVTLSSIDMGPDHWNIT